jgi:hypothetical protein
MIVSSVSNLTAKCKDATGWSKRPPAESRWLEFLHFLSGSGGSEKPPPEGGGSGNGL